MNAYFFPISNQDREDILSKHRELYNGYQTLNPAPVENNQPLYTQDFANDKLGMVVNNKGEVKAYTNMGINESVDHKVEEGHMCEQCGSEMTEGVCNECGYGGMVQEQDNGGQLDLSLLGDAIMGSQPFQKLFTSVDPAEFEDEFEYADNMIYWASQEFEEEPFYDDLIEYLKDMYADSFFDAYRVTMGDEFLGDEEIEDTDFEEIDEITADDMDISDEENAYDFESDGPVDVYGTMQNYDYDTNSYHPINSMKDVERYDDSSDINDMFGDLIDGLAFNDDEPSDTFQHDAGDVNRAGDGNLGMDTEDDMDLSDVKPAYTFVSGGSDDPYNEGEEIEEEDIEDEVDESIRESFSEKRKLVKEMFGRMSHFN